MPKHTRHDVTHPIDALFRALWTKAVGEAGYDKAEWKRLERVIVFHCYGGGDGKSTGCGECAREAGLSHLAGSNTGLCKGHAWDLRRRVNALDGIVEILASAGFVHEADGHASEGPSDSETAQVVQDLAGGWVDVHDRLPDRGVDVLVTWTVPGRDRQPVDTGSLVRAPMDWPSGQPRPSGPVGDVWLCGGTGGNGSRLVMPGAEVTHWRPLPAAPAD